MFVISKRKPKLRPRNFYAVHSELRKYKVIDDLSHYPQIRAKIEKLRARFPDGSEAHGMDVLLNLIKHVHCRPVEIHPVKYIDRLQILREILKKLQYDFLVVVGRSTMSHIVPSLPLWEIIDERSRKGQVYWLNTRRERDVNWENPRDPHSMFAVAAIRNMVNDLILAMGNKKKGKIRVVVLDDVVGTGKTIRGIGKTLTREVARATNGRVRVEVIPVALVGGPISFLISSGLVREKELPLHDHNKAFEAANTILKVASYIAHGVRPDIKLWKKMSELGINEETVRGVVRKLREKYGIFPPLFAISVETEEFSPLSHAISDAIEECYQKNRECVNKLGDVLHQVEELLAHYNDMLEQQKTIVRRRVKMYPRTRAQ